MPFFRTGWVIEDTEYSLPNGFAPNEQRTLLLAHSRSETTRIVRALLVVDRSERSAFSDDSEFRRKPIEYRGIQFAMVS
jgi:hypothetical protein